MVAVMMPSNFLSHVSPSVNATLLALPQFSTWKPLTDDALHYHLIEAASLVHWRI